jgi:Alcohol dehydrogenase GroES-like domain
MRAVPGHEFSGVITAIGKDVQDFEIGDEVYGMNDWFADGGDRGVLNPNVNAMLDVLRISPYQQSDFRCGRKPSGPSVACSRMASAFLGRSNVRNPNSAVAVRARAFSLCVAVALIVSCGSSRNKADDVKAATDAIRQQIAKYSAALDAANLNLASQVWRTSAEISFIHPPVTHTAGRK